MTRDPRDARTGGTGSDDQRDGIDLPATRRDVLRATGASAAGLAAGSAATGTTAGRQENGIPTPRLETREVQGEDGTRLVLTDPNGNEVTLRGLNIADPKRINVTAPARGKTATDVIDAITDPDDGAGWYPRVIRVPVQPIDIGEHEPGHTGGPPEPPAFTEEQLVAYCEDHLDEVVDYVGQKGFYCIVDFHRHWQGQEWDDPALTDEVVLFWNFVADRYRDRDHVVFEVYNEPTEPGIWGDPVTDDYWAGVWEDYHSFCDQWISAIRDGAGADNLVIVGSPSWTQTPEGYYAKHFGYENLAYTYHIYPGHSVSQDQGWDEVGTDGQGTQALYEDIPLFATEFGWQNDINDRYLQGTTSGFGDPFLQWLEGEGQWNETGDDRDHRHDQLHWTAWCADPIWLPAMYERPFTDSDDSDSIGHPYEDPIPEECPQLVEEGEPCDWLLLGSESGTYDDYSGQRIKDALYRFRDHGVPEAPVDPPSNPRVTGTTTSSVDVAWDASADAAEYRVYVDGTLDQSVAADTTSATVDGLDSASTYEVTVTAVTADGAESPGVGVEATTDRASGDPPAAPTNLSATDVGTTSVSLDWDASEHAVTGYNVYVDGALDHAVDAGVTSTTVQGLADGTSYTLGVASVDGDLESEPATVDVTTEVANAAPAVDQFDVSNKSSRNWAKARVEWAVSDAEGALGDLTLELVDASGTVVDSLDQQLYDGSANGREDLKERGGGGEYTVELTVTDQAGNVTTASQAITL